MEFVTSKSNTSGYPKSIKTLMCVNSEYWLNPELLDRGMAVSSKSGHFPPNTNRYSTIIHESGHFLTFVATMKKYGLTSVNYLDQNSASKFQKVLIDWNNNEEPLSIAKEAYENYKKKYNDNLSFDEFRATISGYAMQKEKWSIYISRNNSRSFS